MNNYFVKDENVHIDAFLQVPKILFTDKYKKLSTNAKLIYSLYLNRYVGTTFKDEKETSYIIYPDKELQYLLDIDRATCSRAKKDLIELGLINTEKSVSYNRIYLHNFNQSDNKEYYSIDDIKAMQFYKFPIELFNEQYEKLSLNTKLLYVYYLDFISLSQRYDFVDSNERVFFYDESTNQGKEINLAKSTVATLKNMLYASGLLLKYQSYSKKAQYYLKKLSAFDEESLNHYLQLTKEQQKAYIKKKNKIDNEQFSKFATSFHVEEKKLQHHTFPELQHGKVEKKDIDFQLSNNQFIDKESSVLQKSDDENSKKATHIINTKLNNTKLNNDLINYINKLLSFINSETFNNNEKGYITASLEKLKEYPRFILKKREQTIQLEIQDVYDQVIKIQNEYQFTMIVSAILDRIKSNGYYFKTPENQINCFLTFFFNELTDKTDLESLKEPDWFNAMSFTRPPKGTPKSDVSMFDDDIKNLNWWDN